MTCLIAWLFYDSLMGLFSIGVVAPLLIWDWKQTDQKRLQYELEQQFQTGLIFCAGALEAGSSTENAWIEMEKEVTRLFGDASISARLLRQMNGKIAMGEPMEKCVLEIAKGSGSKVLRSFSDVFYFAKKSGGNMSQIMRKTADRIGQSFAIQEEIQLAVSARRLELLVLHVMPLAILAYLKIGSSAFLSPLYHTGIGILIMNGCLILYGVSWWLSKKWIRIGEWA